MKIKMIKDENGITTKIIDDNNVEKDFSNLEMIDYLYKKGSEVLLDFDKSISNEEQYKIKELFDEIKKKVSEAKKENTEKKNNK